MKSFNSFLSFIIFALHINTVHSFITNANLIIHKEQKVFSDILNINNLPCHLQSSRIKSFESAMEKLNRINYPDGLTNSNDEDKINIYNIYDLIGFRYVFYTKEDLLKFYHHIRVEKTILYVKNYINEPKENGYSAIHIRYKNEYKECPIKQMECQLYILWDYYNAMYGEAEYFKDYINYF